MNLNRTMPLTLIALTALGTLHCSSSSDGGSSAGAAPVAGATASGGAGAGGSASGGAPGGAGAPTTGGTASGGASSGGTASGGASTAGTASGGAATGGSSAGGQSGSAGASAGAAGAATGGAGGGGGFTLSSSKLTAGAAIPSDFTCASTTDHSPPLTWTAGPTGTLSYALVLQDTTNMLNHWVVWDMPPTTSGLSESLPAGALTMPAGAKQQSAQGTGYLGPCPSGTMHTYVFTIYALDVATLPGVTATSMTAALATAIQMHEVASAKLSGTSDAKKP